jgi:phosphoadenosine phosphosulfate reductase
LVDLSQLENFTAAELLGWAIRTYAEKFAIATSFQKEGMVILDMATALAPGVRVFTLDTGRLPEETHRMMETVRTRYDLAVDVVMPDREEVERMVSERGPNLFYESLEARQLCCELRKVRPLARHLRHYEAWATGLRREQSEGRSATAKAARVDGRVKLCPLADWTSLEVEQYIREHNVPVHPLYARGYTSIGCAPCTRAVGPGGEERAGRWWWEQDGKKECGIHIHA